MSVDLPVFRFDLDSGEVVSLRRAPERVITRRRYVLGAEAEAFEREYVAFSGTRDCVGVANGTDALELPLVALGIRAGDGVATMADWSPGEFVAHLLVVRCRDRGALRARLAVQGIGTDVHYLIPDHLQPTEILREDAALPITEAASGEVVKLPFFPGMTEVDVSRVIGAIRNHYADGRDD